MNQKFVNLPICTVKKRTYSLFKFKVQFNRGRKLTSAKLSLQLKKLDKSQQF